MNLSYYYCCVAVALLVLTEGTSAWTLRQCHHKKSPVSLPMSAQVSTTVATSTNSGRVRTIRASTLFSSVSTSTPTTANSGGNTDFDWTEFDYLLHEQEHGDMAEMMNTKATTSRSRLHSHPHSSRRVIQIGNGNGNANQDIGTVIFTSTGAAASTGTGLVEDTSSEEHDPYDSADVDYYQQQQQQLGKIQQLTDQQSTSSVASLERRLKQMDIQDIVITLVVPGIISFVSLRWGFNQVSSRLSNKADALLESFAREMIYHDGNYEEMRMCHADYSRQLMWMGPKRADAMLKRYLADYAKRKTVTPKSISTLSYVFTLFKLSEQRAAQVLVALCQEMGEGKISSAGKILFFGSRIIKSPEGKAALEPIKDMIKSTYRDEQVAETLVETSQQAIAEAAYRSTVLAAGKGQKTLTPGWEVLGLDKDTATRIFEAEAEEGFRTERETMYGGQAQRYDKKGRKLNEDGKLQDPIDSEGDIDDEESSNDAPASNVFTCSNCGYTLFIAKGREFKFYGDDFKCPECGAAKDKFHPADITDD